jgi:UDP-N-acetylmuramate dehydrogenase
MKVVKDPSLSTYNTFKVHARASEIILLEEPDDYMDLLRMRDFKSPFFILGEGSNILFTKDYPGTIIKNQLNKITRLKENKRHVWLKVDAGVNWHNLVCKTIDMGLQGLENLSLIPGTVGAAPIQNIGAYGVEVQQFLEKVEALDLQGGEFFHFDNKDCEFSYRSSIFKTKYKDRFLITAIILRLNKIPEINTSYEKIMETMDILGLVVLSPKNISKAIIHIRKSKLPDPEKIGNAGSFFKNPIIDKTDLEGLKAEFPEVKAFQVDKMHYKIPAAWLIESCGWKGKSYGKAGVYKDQPLVLVNLGDAEGREILELSKKIQKDVASRFGLILQPEVLIM